MNTMGITVCLSVVFAWFLAVLPVNWYFRRRDQRYQSTYRKILDFIADARAGFAIDENLFKLFDHSVIVQDLLPRLVGPLAVAIDVDALAEALSLETYRRRAKMAVAQLPGLISGSCAEVSALERIRVAVSKGVSWEQLSISEKEFERRVRQSQQSVAEERLKDLWEHLLFCKKFWKEEILVQLARAGITQDEFFHSLDDPGSRAAKISRGLYDLFGQE